MTRLSAKAEGSGFADFFKNLLPWRWPSAQKEEPVSQVGLLYTPNAKAPTPAQQKNLEALCMQLFKKKELITSGKLQLLGLTQVKKSMGNEWAKKSTAIFAIVEDTLRKHMVPGDFFIRYKDDTYVIIFDLADFDEGNARMALIAEEIRQKLYDSGDQHIRSIGVAQHTGQTKSTALHGKAMSKALDVMDLDCAPEKTPDNLPPSKPSQRPEAIKAVQVQADWRYGAGSGASGSAQAQGRCSYFPLWDVVNSTLSANLCRQDDASLRDAERDFRTLEIMAQDILTLKQKTDAPAILCPVRHGTLCHHDHGPQYLGLYKKIITEHRPRIVFVISDFVGGTSAGDAFDFFPALRSLCGYICAEVPIGQKTGFSAWREKGFEALKFSMPDAVHDESGMISYLTSAGEQAKSAAFPHVFVTNIPTRSLVTSLTCMGFQYLGGPAIHQAVPLPAASEPFDYSRLFNGKINR